MAAVVAVPSRLRSISLKKAVSHLDMYEQFLESLPSEVKDSFLQLMSKRGLLTDRNIGSLLHPGVTEIELSECDISDEGLKAICQCPRLQKLDLNSTKDVRTSITASGIKQATQHCKYLRILFLRRCTLVDDSVVKWMGQYCPYITQLNLGGCKLVTDLGVQSLADSCSHLQSLNLSKTKVTDKGLCCLARGACAKALQTLPLLPGNSLLGPVHVIPGQLIASWQLTDPGVNFASVHGLTSVTVHITFSLPQGNFERWITRCATPGLQYNLRQGWRHTFNGFCDHCGWKKLNN